MEEEKYSFERSKLWSATLANQGPDDPHEKARGDLRSAFLAMRRRAATIAGEIARSWASLTDHSVEHMDALWEVADLLVAPGTLTPLEAFLLGGAFLTHDLANGAAAYPGGPATLHGDPRWQDHVLHALHRHLGRDPNPSERAAPPDNVLQEVTATLLRIRHSEQAARLPLEPWKLHETDHFLIDDPELRSWLGPIIGQIARSHGRSIRSVAQDLSGQPRSAPSNLPRDWTYDPLRIAAILRVADAAQVDDRRARPFLMALRRPEGDSGPHWVFQSRTHGPNVNSQQMLVYSASPAFRSDVAEAWWLAWETLQMVDGEVRQTNAMLTDLNRPPLAARGVYGAEDPDRFRTRFPAEGWEPVNVRIRSSDIVSLAEKLGGRHLYGDHPAVPLRELLQNASDAVRARRFACPNDDEWRGRITVRLGVDDCGHWLEVQDNGLGMFDHVLTGPLLDFGTSYWSSTTMIEDYPGLRASSFKATGRFGIGFFSVFMWSTRVRVTTRPCGEGYRTRVLEFPGGIRSRPTLRDGTKSELLSSGGTRVRLWLHEAPRGKRGLLGQLWPGANLAQLCAWLAPTLDVDLYASEGDDGAVSVLEGNDWRDVEAMTLVRRLYPEPDALAADSTSLAYAAQLALGMRTIVEDDGTIVGRGTITTPYSAEDLKGHAHAMGATVVGGLRSQPLGVFMGVLVASPENAARTLAVPIASEAALRRWAEQQRDVLKSRWGQAPERLIPCAAVVHACGADTGPLPIAIVDDVPVNAEELVTRVRDWPIVRLLQSRPRRLSLKYVAIMESQAAGSTMLNGGHGWDSWGAWRNRPDYPTFRRLGPEYDALTGGNPELQSNHLWPVIAEAVARAWGTTIGELVAGGLAQWQDIAIGDEDDPATSALVLRRLWASGVI